MSQKDRKAILFFSLVGGLVLSVLAMIIYSMTQEDVKGDEGFVTYEDLRTYDHDLQTKEGGIFDLWEDSKRQDERIQNNWEYINSIDARLYEVEKKLDSMKQSQGVGQNESVMVLNVPPNNLITNPLIRKSKADQDQELANIVNDAVGVYLAETNRNPSCFVGENGASLADIIQSKIIQEGGYEIGSAGRRTNNPGSLRNDGVLRQVVGFEHVDNTNKWRVYATMQDGVVDMAYLIDQKYGCTITKRSVFAYIYGPRAERTQARLANIDNVWNNFYARLAQ